MNHGLGWYGVNGRDAKIWNLQSIDGPVLYGYNGGVLGTNQFGVQKSILQWRNDGRVIIGDVMPSGDYSLYVERGILTERIRVAIKTTSDWRDNVFNADYGLMPLGELKTYIETNHHLPEIPSTTEVMKDGVDLLQINALLLQKVEELTLYVIKQQEEIAGVASKLSELLNTGQNIPRLAR